MLSLRSYDIPTLEVEAPDGEILHVLPASKRMIDRIAKMDVNSPKALDELYDTLAECLSQNREGRIIGAGELDELPITVVKQMMLEYTQFIHGKVDGAKN